VGNNPAEGTLPLCPSARPDMDGSVVFGVVGGAPNSPLVAYLTEPQPVSPPVLALTQPLEPTEVLRFAAPCAGSACQHFDGQDCRLATKIVDFLPPVVATLPPCRLRPRCRWWQQEGRAACLRCPMVTTQTTTPSDALRRAADPQVPPQR
jgi:hypothetical protein